MQDAQFASLYGIVEVPEGTGIKGSIDERS